MRTKVSSLVVPGFAVLGVACLLLSSVLPQQASGTSCFFGITKTQTCAAQAADKEKCAPHGTPVWCCYNPNATFCTNIWKQNLYAAGADIDGYCTGNDFEWCEKNRDCWRYPIGPGYECRTNSWTLISEALQNRGHC